jgi:hypothetical protein
MPLERGAPDISAYHAAQKPGFWPRPSPRRLKFLSFLASRKIFDVYHTPPVGNTIHGGIGLRFNY